MSETTPTHGLPTVVLVHGAFADASSWNGVIERLQAKGVPVTAPANPLRGIATDSAYIAAVLEQIDGPGPRRRPLVRRRGDHERRDEGEERRRPRLRRGLRPRRGRDAWARSTAASKDSVLNSALVPRQYPTADGGSRRRSSSIDPAKVRDAFAADLSDEEAALMAATQRPVAELGVLRADGPAGLEAPAVLGRRRHRRQGGRHRRRPLDGGAGRRDDHRGRGLARDHGLAASGRDRRDPRSRRGGHGDEPVGASRCPSRPSPRHPPLGTGQADRRRPPERRLRRRGPGRRARGRAAARLAVRHPQLRRGRARC